MSFYPELDHLNLEELTACFQDFPIEAEESAFIYYSEVALLIAQQGETGVAFLSQEIDRADTERLQAILFALTKQFGSTESRVYSHSTLDTSDFGFLTSDRERQALLKRLVSYLQDERSPIVAETVDGLCRLGAKDTVNQVLALKEHPSGYVRGSVLRFMTHLHPDKAFPLLIEALKDPDFIVRENAADELGELYEVKAIPYLRPLLADSHPDVRQAAQTALEMLKENELTTNC